MTVSIVGLDAAKSVFQVHGVDAGGRVELKRRLQRSEVVAFFERLPRCMIAMEACASAHHWGRVLGRLGHEVRLIAAEAVRPFVKRGKKNDAADAAAIVVAASRPDTKFVAVKSSEQQGVLALHSARALLVKQQTMLANAMRSLAAEFGLVGPKGTWRLEELATLLEADEEVPEPARRVFADLLEQFHILADRIGVLEAAIVTHARQSANAHRLATIPGIGPITASLIAATVGDGISRFASGRHFAAWLGLVPRQHSSGGRTQLGRITKAGNREIRRLLVLGATSMTYRAGGWTSAVGAWVRSLLERRPVRHVTVALANKMARIAWAVLAHNDVYRPNGRPAPVVTAG